MSASAVGSRRWGLALVFATAGVSGVSTFVNAYAVGGASSDGFVTVRNALVALLILPWGLWAFRSLGRRLSLREWSLLATVGLVGGAIPFLLFFRGLELATAGGAAATASFVYRTLVLMASVLGLVVLRERFRSRLLVGAVLLLAGNALLLELTAPVWSLGSLYVLAATALWAGEYTVSKHLLARIPSGTVALGRMGFGAVFLVAFLFATSAAGSVGTFGPSTWVGIGVSALLLAVFVMTWYSGLARVDLTTAAAVLVLGFPITWLLGVLVHGGTLLLPAALGAGMVVAGVGMYLALPRASWVPVGQGPAPGPE
jgi:drug/metabolite transporter (DMT)-like permease